MTEELRLLKIRSLISQKEMITAEANMDLARRGEWSCNYAEWHRQIDEEISKLFDAGKEVE